MKITRCGRVTRPSRQTAIRRYSENLRQAQGLEVQIRVGLNSGEVVVRAIGNDLHMDYTAVGQTTHLAARMEQLALPGTIRLTLETWRLAEGFIEVKALGPVPVKGLAHPVDVCELVGATAVRRRLQATAARGLTRFVGRQMELDVLRQALERAKAGHGQIVAMVGEPGVGKSRLVYEFVHAHQTQGWLVLESASVSYGKATPYFPVIDLLKRYCHLEESDDSRTIRAKVTGQVLTLDDMLQDTIPALLALLDALPADNPFQQLDPPQRRQRTLAALKRVLLRESQAQPLMLVCEDLHWIDSETQALLDSLVESLPSARLLLLVNYRPEYQHGWGSRTDYTQLRLDPLPPAGANEVLRALLGDDPRLAPLRPLLIARTEGNPFFLEESVRTLVETGVLLGEPGAYRLAQALPTIQVPATVQAVLAARIDRLPAEEKRLLQTAAVIGTEVPLPLLQAIAELPEASLQRSLAHLQAAEFLNETRLFPEREYTFKHALTHEVAYGSLLQERRRVLHARIVEALAGERVTEQVERLAHHALRGEVWDKALAYFRQAGEKAMARSAHREAVGYFEQALRALPHLPEQRGTLEQAIDLRLALRYALLMLGELGRVLLCLREAESLAETLDDHRRLGQISAYLTDHFWNTGELDRALKSGHRALAIGTDLGDMALQVRANLALGHAYQALGEFRRALDHFRRDVSTLTGDQSRVRLDPGAVPIMDIIPPQSPWMIWCFAELGAFGEGLTRGEEVLRTAEAVNDLEDLVGAYYGVGLLFLRKGDLPTALARLECGLGLCQGKGLTIWFSAITAILGYGYALAGRLGEALPLLERAIELEASMGIMGGHALLITWLSEAYLLAGRTDDAMPLAEQALVLSREHRERGDEARALRLLGEIYSRRDTSDAELASTYYQQALALAEVLGMRPLQAHCHRGLGTLYAKIGRAEQAHTELSMAIELYRAMDMTFWLPQAEAAQVQAEGR
jgi:tetratricopeptide (TPR) repeat protein